MVLRDECPGEGCSYGEWFADRPLDVYPREGEPRESVFRLQRGEPFTALGGSLHVTRPLVVRVVRSHSDHDGRTGQPIVFPPGDAMHVLGQVGEGRYLVWHNGAIKAPFIFWPDPNSSGQELDAEVVSPGEDPQWWVNVRDRRGKTGWIRNDAGYALREPPALLSQAEQPASPPARPRREARAARSMAVATPPPPPALAAAERAFREGRFWTPPEDSAFRHAAEVLQAMPAERRAARVLDEIIAGVTRDTRATRDTDPDRAFAIANEALSASSVFPELRRWSAALAKVREELRKGTRVFELRHSHGMKLMKLMSDGGRIVGLGEGGCLGSFELWDDGFTFKTRTSADRRRDEVAVKFAEIKKFEIRDQQRELRLKTTSRGDWEFQGDPAEIMRIYDFFRRHVPATATAP